MMRNYNTWTNRHNDLVSFYFDTAGTFDDVLSNPKRFGAGRDGSKCVGTLPNCLWADDFHPGPALHKYLAQSIAYYTGFKFPEFFTLG